MNTATDVRMLVLPRIMVAEDVADAFFVSRRTAQTWMRTGLIPAKKIKHRWYASREAVVAMLETPALKLVGRQGLEP